MTTPTPSVNKGSNLTPFETKLEKLTKEGFLGGYLVVEKDGLHQVGALRAFWENCREFFGIGNNRTDSALVKDAASKLISANLKEIETSDRSADLVIALAKKAGLIQKNETVNKDLLIQKIKNDALSPQKESTASLENKEIRKVTPNSENETKALHEIAPPILLKSEHKQLQKENNDYDDEGSTTSEKEGEQREEVASNVIEPTQETEKTQTNELTVPTATPRTEKADVSELFIPEAKGILEDRNEEPDVAQTTESKTAEQKPVKDKKTKIKAVEIDLAAPQTSWEIKSLAKVGLAVIAGLGSAYVLSNAFGGASANSTQLTETGNTDISEATSLDPSQIPKIPKYPIGANETAETHVTSWYPAGHFPQNLPNISNIELNPKAEYAETPTPTEPPNEEIKQEGFSPVTKPDYKAQLPEHGRLGNEQSPKPKPDYLSQLPEKGGTISSFETQKSSKPTPLEEIVETSAHTPPVETKPTPSPVPSPSSMQREEFSQPTKTAYTLGEKILGGLGVIGILGAGAWVFGRKEDSVPPSTTPTADSNVPTDKKTPIPQTETVAQLQPATTLLESEIGAPKNKHEKGTPPTEQPPKLPQQPILEKNPLTFGKTFTYSDVNGEVKKAEALWVKDQTGKFVFDHDKFMELDEVTKLQCAINQLILIITNYGNNKINMDLDINYFDAFNAINTSLLEEIANGNKQVLILFFDFINAYLQKKNCPSPEFIDDSVNTFIDQLLNLEFFKSEKSKIESYLKENYPDILKIVETRLEAIQQANETRKIKEANLKTFTEFLESPELVVFNEHDPLMSILAFPLIEESAKDAVKNKLNDHNVSRYIAHNQFETQEIKQLITQFHQDNSERLQNADALPDLKKDLYAKILASVAGRDEQDVQNLLETYIQTKGDSAGPIKAVSTIFAEIDPNKKNLRLSELKNAFLNGNSDFFSNEENYQTLVEIDPLGAVFSFVFADNDSAEIVKSIGGEQTLNKLVNEIKEKKEPIQKSLAEYVKAPLYPPNNTDMAALIMMYSQILTSLLGKDYASKIDPKVYMEADVATRKSMVQKLLTIKEQDRIAAIEVNQQRMLSNLLLTFPTSSRKKDGFHWLLIDPMILELQQGLQTSYNDNFFNNFIEAVNTLKKLSYKALIDDVYTDTGLAIYRKNQDNLFGLIAEALIEKYVESAKGNKSITEINQEIDKMTDKIISRMDDEETKKFFSLFLKNMHLSKNQTPIDFAAFSDYYSMAERTIPTITQKTLLITPEELQTAMSKYGDYTPQDIQEGIAKYTIVYQNAVSKKIEPSNMSEANQAKKIEKQISDEESDLPEEGTKNGEENQGPPRLT